MLFPIINGIIAPNLASANSPGPVKTINGLATKPDGRLSAAFGTPEQIESGAIPVLMADERAV